MELPLRVLVAAVVVGLTLPAIVSGLSAVEAAQVSARAEAAVDAIVRAAQDFYLAGGGAQTLRVDCSGGTTVRLESVSVGDVPGGPLATSARYKVSGQPAVFLLADPPVPMAADGGPLRLGPGRHTVSVSYEGVGPVRLAVVD